MRNRLLQYFEARPLSGPDLQELCRLWRERSSLPPQAWLWRLLAFAEAHPQPAPAGPDAPLAPPSAADLECIAWGKVIRTN